MTEFITSDTGFILGWVLLFAGLTDIIAGLYVFGKKFRETGDPRLRQVFTWLMWIASFFVLLGLYILSFHM